jgi:four helix bundle protein
MPQLVHRYKYRAQMADAARSAPRNIAEGFGRFNNKEFANFSRFAKGSLVEVLNHLIDAHDQQLISDEQFRELEHLTRIALKATVGLIQHLERTKKPPRK